MKCYFGMVRCGDCEYFLSAKIRDFEEVIATYRARQTYLFYHPDNADWESYRIDSVEIYPAPHRFGDKHEDVRLVVILYSCEWCEKGEWLCPKRCSARALMEWIGV